MLDFDLATCFEIKTKNLNKAAKRIKQRLPEPFMFKLSGDEYYNLKKEPTFRVPMNETKRRFLPNAFSEHGILTLSMVLRSEPASRIAIHLVTTIGQMRLDPSYQSLPSVLSHRLKSLETKFDNFIDSFATKQTKRIDHQEKKATYPTKNNKRSKLEKGLIFNEMMNELASEFCLSTKDIYSKTRQQPIAIARQVGMFLARRQLTMSYSEIGNHFGSKDHSTVIHACKKIEAELKLDSKVSNFIQNWISKKVDATEKKV